MLASQSLKFLGETATSVLALKRIECDRDARLVGIVRLDVMLIDNAARRIEISGMYSQ